MIDSIAKKHKKTFKSTTKSLKYQLNEFHVLYHVMKGGYKLMIHMPPFC